MLNIFGQLKDKITRYIDVHVRLVKITVIEKTSALLSHFMLALIILFLVFFMLLYLGFGLGEAFVAAGLSRVAAAFLVPVVYLVLLIVVLLARKAMVTAFSNMFIKVLSHGDDEDDDDNDEDERKNDKS